MKKYWLATGVVTAALVTSACSSEDSSGGEEASSEESSGSSNEENSEELSEEELEQQQQELEEREAELEEQEQNMEESSEPEETSEAVPSAEELNENKGEYIGETFENDYGQLTLRGYNDETIETSSGPFDVAISEVEVMDYTFTQETQDLYDVPAESTVVNMNVEATNTSEDTISFYPGQGTLTTSTGNQTEADLFLSESFGMEFVGEVSKEGAVTFVLGETVGSDIDSVRYLVDAPIDEETFMPVDGAEDIDQEIEIMGGDN